MVHRTDDASSLPPKCIMERELSLRVVTADRTREGVLIEFDDGRAAFYPTALLLAVFPQALELEDLGPDDEI